jgi:hypothetical protein
MKSFLTLFLATALFQSHAAHAEEQVLDDQDIVNIESLYNKTPQPVVNQRPTVSDTAPEAQTNPADQQKRTEELNQVQEQIKKEKIERLTDLNTL